MRSFRGFSVFLISFIFLGGCSELGFYWQAATGHLSLLNSKQDIQELMDSPNTSPELKRKLKLVESTRRFAKHQLTISVNGAYTGYVDLEKPYVTLIVTAAPTLELRAHQWCYLFIGCQEYRGFFAEEDAKSFAAETQTQNFDVSIRPVTAYSTLGWLNKSWMPNYFSDPVLSTILRKHDADLIATLIHEMAHKIVFVKNDTSFNESFAVFVEQEGLWQFLTRFKDTDLFKGDGEKIYQWYLSAKKDKEVFRKLIENTYKKMKILFASKFSKKEKLQKKQELFEELRKNYFNQKRNFQVLSYDKWFEKKLNNTHLLGVKRYTGKVEKFAILFEKSGRNWQSFFKTVRDLANASQKERNRSLAALK